MILSLAPAKHYSNILRLGYTVSLKIVLMMKQFSSASLTVENTDLHRILTRAEMRSRFVISDNKPSSVFFLRRNTKNKLITIPYQLRQDVKEK